MVCRAIHPKLIHLMRLDIKDFLLFLSKVHHHANGQGSDLPAKQRAVSVWECENEQQEVIKNNSCKHMHETFC